MIVILFIFFVLQVRIQLILYIKLRKPRRQLQLPKFICKLLVTSRVRSQSVCLIDFVFFRVEIRCNGEFKLQDYYSSDR